MGVNLKWNNYMRTEKRRAQQPLVRPARPLSVQLLHVWLDSSIPLEICRWAQLAVISLSPYKSIKVECMQHD